MARIKVCPKCNHRNPSSQSQCICGESLFNIKAISEDVYEKQLAEQAKLAEAKLSEEAESSASLETGSDSELGSNSSLESTSNGDSKFQDLNEAFNTPNSNINTINGNGTTNSASNASDSVGNDNNNDDSNKNANNVHANGNNDSSYSDGVLIKICPHCGSENRGVAKICKVCSTNIKQVKAEYRTNSSASNSNNASTNASNNSVNVNNQTCNVKTKLFVGRLASPDCSYSFDVDSKHPVIQIGREASMSEYLDEHMFTSRIHAEISIVGDKLAIKDLGKPNGTFVNNKRLSPYTLTLLECGDKVSLGGKWEDDWKTSQAGCFIVYYDE